jgi:hypothetical protein
MTRTQKIDLITAQLKSLTVRMHQANSHAAAVRYMNLVVLLKRERANLTRRDAAC